jgi:hypothetical protein
MKRYFVLALALVVFAVAPVMADVSISGAYDYSAVWNTGDEVFVGTQDDLSLDFKAGLDDFNTFVLKTDGASDADLAVLDYMVTTDWGKYFGFAESGFGLKTKVGHWDPETSDIVKFTAYEMESQNPDIEDKASWQINMDIMGIVKPYAAMNFETYGSGGGATAVDGSDFLVGADFAFAPIAAEVYYKGDSSTDAIGSVMGLGVLYSGEVSDGIVVNAGATYSMTKEDPDNFLNAYSVAAGVEAYGAVANLALGGFFGDDAVIPVAGNSYALSWLTFDASYSILEWLGVNAGMMMSLGDSTDDIYGESLVGAEFGVAVSPGAVTYSLGYIVMQDTASGYDSYVTYGEPANGGIYFAADLSY